MNEKERLERAIMLLTALKDGKQLVYTASDSHRRGIIRTANLCADFLLNHPERYEVKREPRTFWVNVYPDDYNMHVYRTKKEADSNARRDRGECIKVVEEL